MRTKVELLLLVAGLMGVTACRQDAEPDTSALVTRDSAGLAIAENKGPLWSRGQEWRVSEIPLLDLGEADGRSAAHQFDHVEGALRLSDGTIVVADGSSRQLRYFTSAGVHVRSAGGRGNGPGEFRELVWIGTIAGDSVVAWDAPNRRLSFFDAKGGFSRAVTLDVPGIAPRLRGASADGLFILTPGLSLTPPSTVREGERRDTIPLLRFQRTGILLDTLGHLVGPESFVISSAQGVSTHRIPFGREELFAAGASEWYLGDNATHQVVRLAFAKAPRVLIRWSGTLDRVERGDLSEYYRERRTDLSFVPPSLRTQLEERAEEERRLVPHRGSLPAYSSLLAGVGGELWVETARRPGDQQPRWSVFGRDGRWLSVVATPPGLTILQAGPGWLLGLYKDSMEVEHVRLYRIEKPAAAGLAHTSGQREPMVVR